MSTSSRHPLLRHGVAILAITVALVLLTVPSIGKTPNVPVFVFYAAILLSAWYGGRGWACWPPP
jgi:uncharacterized membrane protein YhhN